MKLANSYISNLNIGENDPVLKPADVVGVTIAVSAIAVQKCDTAISGEIGILTGTTDNGKINLYLNGTMINQLVDNGVIPDRYGYFNMTDADDNTLTVVSFQSKKFGSTGYRFD